MPHGITYCPDRGVKSRNPLVKAPVATQENVTHIPIRLESGPKSACPVRNKETAWVALPNLANYVSSLVGSSEINSYVKNVASRNWVFGDGSEIADVAEFRNIEPMGPQFLCIGKRFVVDDRNSITRPVQDNIVRGFNNG